ncbi:hypothetical protein [Metabacillus litoralis]|uniref:hypothetical protein n=1 Tax=Metabacillus litoralis TaxID=152268 RepID=UPI001CFCAA53|nr:hypothetical protein [Metabacillus litoralis]
MVSNSLIRSDFDKKQKNTVSRIVYLYISMLYITVSLAYDVSSIVVKLFVFFLSTLLIIKIYKLCKRRMSIIGSLVALLCISMPISFRNVFGGSYAEIPLPWFYIILIIFIIGSLLKILKDKTKVLPQWSSLLIWLVLASVIPLMVSGNLIEGFKEFLSYLTFLLGVLGAIIHRNNLVKQEYHELVNFYIFGVIFSSIGIILQYFTFHHLSAELFRMEFYGGGRVYLSFLFFDMSGITVYMSTAILFLILLKKRMRFTLSILIILAMTLSTARAGIISLSVVMFIYLVFSSNLKNKIYILLFLIVGISIGINILSATRTNISGLTNILSENNGRFEPVILTLKAIVKSPLVGYGYDFGDQLVAVGSVVPHFALINILGQSGIVIAICYIIIVYNIFKIVKSKKMDSLLWVITLSLVGSCVSPGFFDLRFFTILAIIGVLYRREPTIKVDIIP